MVFLCINDGCKCADGRPAIHTRYCNNCPNMDDGHVCVPQECNPDFHYSQEKLRHDLLFL